MRLLRWCLAAALVLPAGAAAAVRAAPAAPCGGNTAYAGNGWLAVHVPKLDSVGILRSVPFLPDRLYASDGNATLMRSDDAGCSWTDISPLPPTVGGLGAASESLSISAVSAPSNARQSTYLYVAANVRATDALPVSLPSQPYVYVDPSGGRPTTVRDSNNGLPPVGRITDLAAADLTPQDVYAVIADAGSDSGVWASTDAGATWNGPLSADTSLTSLRVDPNVSNHVYALKPDVGIVLSVDGGRSFRPIGGTSGDVRGFAVASGSGSLQIAEGRRSSQYADLSVDAGRTWRRLRVVGHTAPSVAVSPVLPVVAAYDDRQLSIGDATRSSTLTTRSPGIGVPRAGSVEISAPPRRTAVSVVGVAPRGDAILRLVYDFGVGRPEQPSLTPIRLLPQAHLRQFPATLTGSATQLHLAAGASQDVRYSLLLPRTPSPVDLMFLVDTTDSTQQTIDGVRQGLQTVVNEMQSTGLDVRFGLGEFKDYPNWAGGGGDDGDFPYRLRRAIGPADAALRTALARLRSSGGGDSAESDLAALYYSTVNGGDRFGHRVLVPPLQSAGYRGGALRLAFLATDESFQGDGARRYPGPSWGRTVAALTAAGVHQVGLAVDSLASDGKPEPGLYNSLRDQRRMAVATGSLAPRGGVDCDGNGTTDIPDGQPLVCTIDKPADNRVKVPVGGQAVTVGSAPAPLHLAPLVVQLAEGIPDLRSIRLQVGGAPSGIARAVGPAVAPRVNLRLDNNLGYVVRFTCPRSHVAHTWPLDVAATDGSRRLAWTRATLTCAAAPPHPLAAAAPPAAAITVAAAVPPGSPPNPPPNVNANPNPNPAVNPNAGFAQQDEAQPQLALADADQGVGEETSLAMSRRRSSDTDAALFLAAAGLMAAGAAGFATRTRWRTADVRSRM